MVPTSYRLAVVAHRPQPYHSPFYRALAAHPRIDLTVYYLFDVGIGAAADADFGRYRSDYPLLDGYRSVFLRNRAPWPDATRFTGGFHPELFFRLHSRHHDAALIQGWFRLSVWLAYFTCWVQGLPILFRSGANVAEPLGPRLGAVKNWFLPRLFRRCRAFITAGTRNAEFYRHWGVPQEKLFLVPNAVDNVYFQEQASRLRPQRADIRRRLGVPPEAVVFLYAGRLAPEKRLPDLLTAFHRLADPRAWLLLAGDGRERPRLEQQVRSLGLRQVLFTGFLNQGQLAESYAATDVLVLPSEREYWGLVINEAMNFAVPVVVSDVVGAVPDLVEHGANGFVFPAGNVDVLTNCLRSLTGDPALRARMGARSREKIQHWSHQEAGETLLRALQFALQP